MFRNTIHEAAVKTQFFFILINIYVNGAAVCVQPIFKNKVLIKLCVFFILCDEYDDVHFLLSLILIKNNKLHMGFGLCHVCKYVQ